MINAEQQRKADFIQNFSVSFLAAWTAKHYDECCFDDTHAKLESPPVEDAILLAENAFKLISEFSYDAETDQMTKS